MPSFANQNTMSSSNNNSSSTRQQHSRVAKNFQRCLPNIPSNHTLAKYASQMALAKYIFKSHTCQICIPNGACLIYFQIAHLPNVPMPQKMKDCKDSADAEACNNATAEPTA